MEGEQYETFKELCTYLVDKNIGGAVHICSISDSTRPVTIFPIVIYDLIPEKDFKFSKWRIWPRAPTPFT